MDSTINFIKVWVALLTHTKNISFPFDGWKTSNSQVPKISHATIMNGLVFMWAFKFLDRQARRLI
jgi:hypothetical protein